MAHADTSSSAEWASLLATRVSDGVRGVHAYFVERLTAADNEAEAPAGRKTNNPFLPIFAVCGAVFVFAILALHRHDHAERRRRRVACRAGGGGGGLPMGDGDDDDDNDGQGCRFGRFVAARREARKERRARLRTSLGAAVGRVAQRLQQWRQTYNEKYYHAMAGDNGDNGGALLPVANPSDRAPRRRSSASRYSMEDEIAQFRAAADMVGQMVLAEEDRCTTAAKPQRPPRPLPPPRPRTTSYMPLEDDDGDAAPPAYSL